MVETEADENRKHAADDTEQPWRSTAEARADGTVCELLFVNAAGATVAPGRWVLHNDHRWYRVDKRAAPYYLSDALGGTAFEAGGPLPMSWRALPGLGSIDPEIIKARSKSITVPR